MLAETEAKRRFVLNSMMEKVDKDVLRKKFDGYVASGPDKNNFVPTSTGEVGIADSGMTAAVCDIQCAIESKGYNRVPGFIDQDYLDARYMVDADYVNARNDYRLNLAFTSKSPDGGDNLVVVGINDGMYCIQEFPSRAQTVERFQAKTKDTKKESKMKEAKVFHPGKPLSRRNLAREMSAEGYRRVYSSEFGNLEEKYMLDAGETEMNEGEIYFVPRNTEVEGDHLIVMKIDGQYVRAQKRETREDFVKKLTRDKKS